MFKFILFACLITKGGAHQAQFIKPKPNVMQAPQSLKMMRCVMGFFVRAVCQELK